GLLITIGVLFIFWYNLKILQVSEIEARTIAFTALVMCQFVPLIVIRNEYNLGLFSNTKLVMAVLLSVVLQMAVVYTGLNKIFATVPLNMSDWMFIGGVWVLLLVASLAASKILKKIGIDAY
ncbi:MAG: hypothetical protein HGA85_09255, partial [Nanoarchaeota archaeon]|nr:hypothetical protein [Nanoarchaeota archaeon]